MRILIISFYYPPDLSACSFRTAGLVRELIKKLNDKSIVDVMTTMPNRYDTLSIKALEYEVSGYLRIRRIKLPKHKSGKIDQSFAFLYFAKSLLSFSKNNNYDIIYATSARFMTALLGAIISYRKRIPLYLDIRDIIVDSIKGSFPPIISNFIKLIFQLVERWTIKRASKVNLVSKGFYDYFKSQYPAQNYSFFTNGIDKEFINLNLKVSDTKKLENRSRLRVLYAGNIGDGQGLHRILPELAKRLETKVDFIIIGDGGRKELLANRLVDFSCNNVFMFGPIKRKQLISEYYKSDVLFLHLNDNYESTKNVLPSKLFEYAAVGKPIWAGATGFTAEFINTEIENAAVFYPCNIDLALKTFNELEFTTFHRSKFIAKFTREKIMNEMTTDILTLNELIGYKMGVKP